MRGYTVRLKYASGGSDSFAAANIHGDDDDDENNESNGSRRVVSSHPKAFVQRRIMPHDARSGDGQQVIDVEADHASSTVTAARSGRDNRVPVHFFQLWRPWCRRVAVVERCSTQRWSPQASTAQVIAVKKCPPKTPRRKNRRRMTVVPVPVSGPTYTLTKQNPH